MFFPQPFVAYFIFLLFDLALSGMNKNVYGLLQSADGECFACFFPSLKGSLFLLHTNGHQPVCKVGQFTSAASAMLLWRH